MVRERFRKYRDVGIDALNLRLGEVFQGWFWGNWLVSVIGAVLLITVYRLIKGRRN